VLAEYNNYPAVLKSALLSLTPPQFEALLTAMGSEAAGGAAQTVIVPLVLPGWGTFATGGQNQTWLPMHKLRGSLTIELTFATKADLAASPGAGANILNSCSLVYTEMHAHAQELDDSPVVLYGQDFQSFPTTVHAGALTDSLFDLSALVGNIVRIDFFHAANFAGDNALIYSDGTARADLQISSSEYWRAAPDAREHSMELAMLGSGKLDLSNDDLRVDGLVTIPLSLYPFTPSMYSGGLPMHDVRSMNLRINTSGAGSYQVVAVSHCMWTKEGTKLVRKRV
jgi:hypothetical protein